MNASAVDTLTRQRDTKVCPRSEAALDVGRVKSERKIKKEAEKDAARLVKATLRLDVPVDPGALANELGVQALVTTMQNKDALGGLLMEPGEDPKIVLNRRDGYLRQRLTCALELGHYLRRSSETNQYERIDQRGPRSRSEKGPEEIYAQEFAACLLMPRQDVEILAELEMDDLQMALHLMVPREAMQMRLRDLGLPAPDLEAV
jgi:Zn-dependent peptidase ImmA (M78 family)